MYRGRFNVPNLQELNFFVLRDMYNVPYLGHPGCHKTIKVVKSQYYWSGMNKEVVDYTTKCLECQKLKDEHKHLASFLQPFPIPEQKWEVVTMDFITKLPRTTKTRDSIMVVVDKLTKATHFIPVKLTHKETNIADIYMREIARLHGVLKNIVSNRDPKFTSNFWK